MARHSRIDPCLLLIALVVVYSGYKLRWVASIPKSPHAAFKLPSLDAFTAWADPAMKKKVTNIILQRRLKRSVDATERFFSPQKH